MSADTRTDPPTPDPHGHPFFKHAHEGTLHTHVLGCRTHYGKPSWKCPECQNAENRAATSASDLQDALEPFMRAAASEASRTHLEDGYLVGPGGLTVGDWRRLHAALSEAITSPGATLDSLADLRPDRLGLALSAAGFSPDLFSESRYGESQVRLGPRSFTDAAKNLLARLRGPA